MIQTWLMVGGLPRWLTDGPTRWADCCSMFRLLMSCCWFCWFLIIYWNVFLPENIASDFISPLSSEGFNGQHVTVVGLSNVKQSVHYKGIEMLDSSLCKENRVRPTFMLSLKTKTSVLELVCWGLLSVFLYKAVFWLTCRYRKQRSAAQGMWSFFCPRLW